MWKLAVRRLVCIMIEKPHSSYAQRNCCFFCLARTHSLTHSPDEEALGRSQRPAEPGVAEELQGGGGALQQEDAAPQPALQPDLSHGARQPAVPVAGGVGAAERLEDGRAARLSLSRSLVLVLAAQHQSQRARRQLHGAARGSSSSRAGRERHPAAAAAAAATPPRC